jgi:hypothetical protein
VRLTRKLTDALDGVDVSKVCVGEVLDLSDADAALLIAERWAEAAGETSLPLITSQSKSPSVT